MRLSKTIQDNLRFLLVEVDSQIKYLHDYFEFESTNVAQRIIDRSGYAYNLKLRIQNASMLHISERPATDTMSIRAVASIAGDLERIAELSRDCVHQLGYLGDSHKLDLSVYLPLLKQVSKSIQLIDEALSNSSTRLALKLGRSESKLDKSYKKLLKKYTRELKNKKHTEDLVTGLFVAYSIEQMGDALLSISESIISCNLGQPIDMQRFQSLRETISAWADEDAISELEIKPVAETRSGSGISSVNYTDGNDDQQLAIYKDGEKRKLKEELDGVNRWHKIYPGVAPKILTYQKSGNSAALLIEHLQGDTFENIVLHRTVKDMTRAMSELKKTLNLVWSDTKKRQSINANFIGQTRKRLPDVYAIHPSFKQKDRMICGVHIASFEQLLNKVEKIEQNFPAPFSVFIHGDFNVDNILFDSAKNKINFIDLHRSAYMDYVQDVSVFMISNYRLQVFDKRSRKRIQRQAIGLYSIAKQFAKKNKDSAFEVRLAFGLARSFATSTRFILDKAMARKMFLRAQYILFLILQADLNKPEAFVLPVRELFSD